MQLLFELLQQCFPFRNFKKPLFKLVIQSFYAILKTAYSLLLYWLRCQPYFCNPIKNKVAEHICVATIKSY